MKTKDLHLVTDTGKAGALGDKSLKFASYHIVAITFSFAIFFAGLLKLAEAPVLLRSCGILCADLNFRWHHAIRFGQFFEKRGRPKDLAYGRSELSRSESHELQQGFAAGLAQRSDWCLELR